MSCLDITIYCGIFIQGVMIECYYKDGTLRYFQVETLGM